MGSAKKKPMTKKEREEKRRKHKREAIKEIVLNCGARVNSELRKEDLP